MGSEAKPGKNQHYVPRFYLARFAGSDDRVLVHRLGQAALPIHPLRVAKEKHYNSIRAEDGTMDTTPESTITEFIDRPTAPLLDRIASGNQITFRDHVQLALFMAFQYYRSPARKRELLRIFDKQLQNMLESMVLDDERYRDWLERAGSELTPAQELELQELVRNGEILVSATNAPWLKYAFERARHIAPRIVRERGWTLLRSPAGTPFITSDDPITHYHLSGLREYNDVTVWFEPGVMTVFPIDPDYTILVGARRQIQSLQATPLQARDINRVTVMGSGRMVFTTGPAPWVQTILKKREREASD